MQTVTELLTLLQRSGILSALGLLDDGEKTAFADSTKFDLIFKGKGYAPKRVAVREF
jgi:hypothetical protein